MKKVDLPFMPQFFDRYIDLVDTAIDLNDGLKHGISVFHKIEPELVKKADFRYQPKKWSIKEVLQHCIDTERIMNYRALVFAREGNIDLAGMDENLYARNACVSLKSIEDLLAEFKAVRVSSLFLFKSLTTKQLLQTGTCFGKEMTTLAIGFVLIGHPLHHLNILKERYF